METGRAGGPLFEGAGAVADVAPPAFPAAAAVEAGLARAHVHRYGAPTMGSTLLSPPLSLPRREPRTRPRSGARPRAG